MKASDLQEGGNHYKQCQIQPVEFIYKNNIPFIEGNVVKYVLRHKQKNGLQDLLKAKHYIDLLIEYEYKLYNKTYMTPKEKQTAVEWLVTILNQKIDYIPLDKWEEIRDIVQQAKEMEKEQIGYSKEDVIKIVEKSRETGLTAEYLLLTYKK